MELAYFVLRLVWTDFRPDLVGTEAWDNSNTTNEDGEEAYKKVYFILEQKIKNVIDSSNISLVCFLILVKF